MKNELKDICIKFRSGEEKKFECDKIIINPFFHVELKPDVMGKYPGEKKRKEITEELKNLELNEVVGTTNLVSVNSLAHGESIPIVGKKDGDVIFLTLLNQIEYIHIETLTKFNNS